SIPVWARAEGLSLGFLVGALARRCDEVVVKIRTARGVASGHLRTKPRKIEGLAGRFECQAAINTLPYLIDDGLNQIRFELQVSLVALDPAVAGNDDVGLKSRELAVGGDPVGHVGTQSVRCRRHDHVSARDDALVRQVNDRVASGIGSPEMENLNLAASSMERERGVEDDVRQDRMKRRQLFDLSANALPNPLELPAPFG